MRSVLSAAILLLALATPSAAAESASIFYSRAALGTGNLDSVVLDMGQVALAPGAVSGTWTSAVVQPGATFTRLVASWNADTPTAARLTVEARVTTTTGETSDWYTDRKSVVEGKRVEI